MSNQEPPEVSPKQAWQMLQDDPRALLVDIRSTMEFLFVGHPKGAVHVAWIDEPDWDINPHFVPEIRKLLLSMRAAPR
jgi:rhodanese-related sulfurtransferase